MAARTGARAFRRLDGFAFLFCLLVTGIGTLVVIYAGAYLGEPRRPIARDSSPSSCCSRRRCSARCSRPTCSCCAMYKAALFFCAGTVIHATGLTKLRQMGGLRRFLPVTAAASLLASLSMAGLPP